jgi:Na+/proline symporter
MGILVVGMFASTIATMGSEFNVLAGILTNDLYKRIFRPDASDEQLVKVGKIATVLAGGLIILMATIVASLKGFNLFDIMLKAFGALLPATALPILMGFFWKRISARGALYGLIAGAITGTAFVLINVGLVDANSARFVSHPELQYWLKQGWDSGVILLNSGVTILVMYLASLRYPSAANERERADSYFKDLETHILVETAETTSKARLSNAQVVAVATLLFGLLVTVIGVLLAFQPGYKTAPIMNTTTGLFLSLVGITIYVKEHRDKRRG